MQYKFTIVVDDSDRSEFDDGKPWTAWSPTDMRVHVGMGATPRAALDDMTIDWES